MKDYVDINGITYRLVTMNESKWHDFTKSDWYGYAGAAKLPDGSDPKIYGRDLNSDIGVDVILSGDDYDRNGRYDDDYSTCSVEINYFGEDDDSLTYVIDGLSQRKAWQVFKSIIDDIDDLDDPSTFYDDVVRVAEDHDLEEI